MTGVRRRLESPSGREGARGLRGAALLLAATAAGCELVGGFKDFTTEGTPSAQGSGGAAGAGAVGAGAAGEGGVPGGGGTGGAGGSAGASGGPSSRILLLGKVVTMASDKEPFEGQVLVEGAFLKCVAPGKGCEALPAAAGARVIDTKGIIAPGLIDTHNHVSDDIFDGSYWPQGRLYENKQDWLNEDVFMRLRAAKHCLQNLMSGLDSTHIVCPKLYSSNEGNLRCEMAKFGELKGLVAGTTSIVGLPNDGAPCFASLARSIDVEQNGGLGDHEVQTTAYFPPSPEKADEVCRKIKAGDTKAYLVHCGEGFGPEALSEFEKLRTVTAEDGCLYASQTAITHGVAFTPAEFATMEQADMKLIWSPASDDTLYTKTADIPGARAAGLTVALAPDWSLSGSQNMLDELAFAALWDDFHFGDVLSSRDLVEMATTNAAKVLGLDGKIGALAEGMMADIFVVGGEASDPYDAIVSSKAQDVRLTMVGGRILYGDEELLPEAPPTLRPKCEKLDICGRAKFLCVAEDTAADKLGQTFEEITVALQKGLGHINNQNPMLEGGPLPPLVPLVKCNP